MQIRKRERVVKIHQTIFHIAFDSRHEVNTVVEKYFKKRRRDVSPVSEKFSEQFFSQCLKYLRVSVIHISGSKTKG